MRGDGREWRREGGRQIRVNGEGGGREWRREEKIGRREMEER